MPVELIVAIVGIGGALLGALLQNVISGLAEHQRRVREQAASWGPILIELLDAGAGVERWVQESEETGNPDEIASLQRSLDKAWNRVYLLCPLEVTRIASPYVTTANSLLKGQSNLETLDQNTQRIALVYRRVAGINKMIQIRHRGKRARKSIAQEYR